MLFCADVAPKLLDPLGRPDTNKSCCPGHRGESVATTACGLGSGCGLLEPLRNRRIMQVSQLMTDSALLPKTDGPQTPRAGRLRLTKTPSENKEIRWQRCREVRGRGREVAAPQLRESSKV